MEKGVIKLSDYVARFLARQGIRHVFAISGGASLHLIHSVAETPGTGFVCPQHEQAGAMAADAWARVTGKLGAALSTSGPGATNMLTGVCSSFYDSVPVLYITGQVSAFRLKGETGVRQLGFQETDVVSMFRPVTKYAVQVSDPRRIRYELEKAAFLACTGRPGPVVVDIPDNFQREMIDPEGLEAFVPPADAAPRDVADAQVRRCMELLEGASRPVLIAGWGIRLAHAGADFALLSDRLGIPIAPTWAMLDTMPADHPLLIGAFGTHGTRYGNFAVQNADLILSIGARLDTREAGSPLSWFAREARKIVVDVDPSELGKLKKFGMETDLLVTSDAGAFIRALLPAAQRMAHRDLSSWKARIDRWKRDFPICPPEYYQDRDVNPYVFVKTLAREAREGDTFLLDTGCALAWMMQAFDFKKGQRLFHAFNNTPMGYALPGAIGASFALGGAPVICVTGDGALQMNIQELATVMRHKLPIKIVLINNQGYSMIQQTQDQWLGSKYLASSVEGGLAFPDFVKVAQAYGFRTVDISTNAELEPKLRDALRGEGPVFCNVNIRPDRRVIPQVKFGRPIEDSDPLLDRDVFLSNMIVKPVVSSTG